MSIKNPEIDAAVAQATAGSATAVSATAANKAARADFALWDPVDGRSTTAIKPVRVIVHIAVTRSEDLFGPGTINGGDYAHFYNARSGTVRQHQELNRASAAQREGNSSSISVEHAGIEGDSMTAAQIDSMAKIFAWAVCFCGVPNRMATAQDTTGLAWHRLGVEGNFPPYDAKNPKTWCRRDTGQVWSSARGKACPTDAFIDQLPQVFARAQEWIKTFGGGTPAQPDVLTTGGAVLRDAKGRTRVVAVGANGKLHFGTLDSSTWTWQQVDSSLLVGGVPTMTYRASDNRYDIYAVGADRKLFTKTMTTPWSSVPGISDLAGGVTAVRDHNNLMHLFAIGKGGKVMHGYWTGKAWDWQDLGGESLSHAPAVLYNPAKHSFRVIINSPDGHLYQRSYNPETQWQGWVGGLGATALDKGVVAVGDGSAGGCRLFAAMGGPRLGQAVKSGDTWNWSATDGIIKRVVGATYLPDTDRYDVVAVGTDGKAYTRPLINEKWVGWSDARCSGLT